MRTIKELLILLREKCVTRIPEAKYGICGTIDWLVSCEDISLDEAYKLYYYVEINQPKEVAGAYWWPRGELSPRIEFLNKLIAEL